MRSRLVRTIMSFDEMIGARHRPENRVGAYCSTCLKPSDKEELVEQHRGTHNEARVLVTCHGSEELCTFQFGSQEWDSEDLKKAMQSRVWFDPHGGNGVIANNGELR